MAGAKNFMPISAGFARKVALIALSSSALALPTAAFADCTATGTAVACSGTSAAYTYTGTAAAQVTNASGGTVTAPLVVSAAGSTLTNTGTISNASAIYGVQFGDSATITNNGTLTSSNSTSGSGAINVGTNSTVTNNGTLTAYSGTPVVNFGTNGTFINNTAATSAVTGNVIYGTNTGANVGTFKNYSTTYGFTGTVTGNGNLNVYNSGLFTGNIVQIAKAQPNTVSITNDTTGIFTGVIATGDQTNFVNNGTAYLYGGSAIGTLGVATSQITNTGSLTVGTLSSPAQVGVFGNFAQTSTGSLNIAIAPSGSAANTAGYNYSQMYANGTATLAGTLNLNISAGFYPTGSTYKVVDALGGITGNFSSVTGNSLLFVDFVNNGIVTVSGTEQAYQFTAIHKSYNTVFAANGANSTQLSIAKGLDKLLVTANANTGSDSATVLGQIDILNIAQAKGLLDQISPQGYLAYEQALHDQANTFTRLVDMRMTDQNSDHPEDGWWLTTTAQGSFKSVAQTSRTKDSLFGFSGGYDFSGPRHVYGAAFHVSWDKLTNGNAALTGTNRVYAIALYGAQNFGPVRLSGQLAYNNGKASTNKALTIGDYSRTAAGSANENLLKATLTAGFNVNLKGWTLQPFAGVDFSKGKISGFTETGAGALNLTVNGIKADRTDILAGVSLTRATGMWRPYLKATYRNQQSGGDTVVAALMNGDATTAFTVAGLSKAKNEIDVNSGLNVMFDDAGSLFIGYQGTYRANYQSHGINAGIRLEF